jgi:hypothetical protein
MTRAIITTTINPPKNMDAWEQQLSPGDFIVVAGDLKTPHDEWFTWRDKSTNVVRTYLHPNDQTHWHVSEPTGWNSIQRRNAALLHAMHALQGEGTITTIDDDNWPLKTDSDWFGRLPQPAHHWIASNGWWNPGDMCRPEVRHRGLPFGIETCHKMHIMGKIPRIGVWASLWHGDPDIDAMERIVNDPIVDDINPYPVVLGAGTWAPFNSQSTTYLAELAPIMAVLPHVGRMDDIWASYIARAVMDRLDYHVCYGEPLVRQERNPHNLLADLKGEMIGYEHTLELTEQLRFRSQFVLGSDSLLDAYKLVTDNLQKFDWFPRDTIRFIDAWQKDVRMVLG